MTACPCGSGQNLDVCCGPLIGGTPAATAEALMRSRYSAFVLGEAGYLAETLSPEMRADFDESEAEKTSKDTKWLGLEVRAVTGGGPDDDRGKVEFVVRFRVNNQPHIHHELADFTRENGRWVCAGGTMDPKAPPRRVVKAGRNDPCPCGSGKKYKKCCGA
ncbi:MAG TPA: YchJ family protein [Kiloniellales bacterium]